MGRAKKSVSAIQDDPVIFQELSDQLKEIGIAEFAEHTKVDRRTVYHWLWKKPVEPSTEDTILTGIEIMVVNKTQQLAAILQTARIARKKHALNS